MVERSFAVPEALDGVRVDKAVALLADLTRSTVDGLVVAGRVRVDGAPVRSRRTVLHTGQELVVDHDDPGRGGESLVPDPTVQVRVVLEDPEFVVVDKPAGSVVHPGAGHDTGTLVQGLAARYPELARIPEATGSDPGRPGIVHRLDRGTSGLLVVARTPRAYRSLVEQLSRRAVHRRYRALVEGAPSSDRGVVDAPVGRSSSTPTRMAVTRGGREARTRYEVVTRYVDPRDLTLLDVELETGRTHQIRVHLAAIGHAVVADPVYGRPGPPWPGSALHRPFLHAGELVFSHPVDGRPVRVTAALPADLREVVAELDRRAGTRAG